MDRNRRPRHASVRHHHPRAVPPARQESRRHGSGAIAEQVERPGGSPPRTVTLRGPLYPSLYQINTRVWLTELSRGLGRPATLDDIPDAELDAVHERGFDWVWLLSVWQTGPAAQRISRTNPEWRHEFERTLPDLRDE